jgi:WD40 repeat protein
VSSLSWDPEKKFLYSGSHDKTIICWDIGGQKGVTYDLEGRMCELFNIKKLFIINKLNNLR